MNRYWTAALVFTSLLCGCARKPPYDIISRSEKMQGLQVDYKIGVPQGTSRENLQSWCNEITESEGKDKAVIIEFVNEIGQRQQLGFCLMGTVKTIDDLRRQSSNTPPQ